MGGWGGETDRERGREGTTCVREGTTCARTSECTRGMSNPRRVFTSNLHTRRVAGVCSVALRATEHRHRLCARRRRLSSRSRPRILSGDTRFCLYFTSPPAPSVPLPPCHVCFCAISSCALAHTHTHTHANVNKHTGPHGADIREVLCSFASRGVEVRLVVCLYVLFCAPRPRIFVCVPPPPTHTDTHVHPPPHRRRGRPQGGLDPMAAQAGPSTARS